MYVPIQHCPTSTLRYEAERQGLSAKTRTQLLANFRDAGIYLLETQPEQDPVGPEQDPVGPEQDPAVREQDRDYSPLSPYIPVETLRRSGHLLTDASFSVLNAHIVQSVNTLQVSNIDVIQEIEDIKTLKKELVNNYITLKNDLIHLKDTLESTLNQDLYVYQTANDIEWNQLDQYIRIPGMTYTVVEPTFYGKVEDSTVHGNMHFEIDLQQSERSVDRFTVDLPVAMDETLSLYPIMVLVNSGYNEDTKAYQNESTTCHSYIQRDAPTTLQVICPLLIDESFTRLQFDITLRYFARLQPTMLSPARMSSMWSSDTFTERNHMAKHQWTILGDRVELFTNIDIQVEMDEVDTIRVRLPVESSQFDTIGYGIVHYTIHGTNIIYSSNTPMVRIASTDTFTLVIKSALLQAVNSYNTMHVSTHIVYSRKAEINLVYDFVIRQPYAKQGDVIEVTFKTTTAVNAYYFTGLKAVEVEGETQNEWLLGSSVEGLQSNWSFKWTIPANINEDTKVQFVFDLYEYEYVSSNSLIVPTDQLSTDDIKVEVDHVDAVSVVLNIISIETKFDVPYNIRAEINDVTRNVYDGFTKNTDHVFFQWLGLQGHTAIDLIFTDPLQRETKKTVTWSYGD
jgi:hypothetical protein